jgi:hypothetical protein
LSAIGRKGPDGPRGCRSPRSATTLPAERRRRLFGNPFQIFVHAPNTMEARVTEGGFTSGTNGRLVD